MHSDTSAKAFVSVSSPFPFSSHSPSLCHLSSSFFFFLFYFSAVSQSRDRTCASFLGSTEASLLDHWRSPPSLSHNFLTSLPVDGTGHAALGLGGCPP